MRREDGGRAGPRAPRIVSGGRSYSLVRLRLKARDASKTTTYVMVSGKRATYRKGGRGLILSTRRLAKLRYGSVDLWGNAEVARTVRR